MSEDRAGQVLDRLESESTIVTGEVLDRPYAPPLVASFDMDSLTMGSAAALTPNGRVDQPA
jgi:hypothetical protein